MSEYTPHNWVILKITVDGNTLYKVLGGWSGGFLDGDSWRMNSGITRVVEQDDYWEFYGYSGSCYKCIKGAYRLSMGTSHPYEQLKGKYSDAVKLMDEDTDWNEVKWVEE